MQTELNKLIAAADPRVHDRISARLGRFIADAGPTVERFLRSGVLELKDKVGVAAAWEASSAAPLHSPPSPSPCPMRSRQRSNGAP